jgi:hypothetical protein
MRSERPPFWPALLALLAYAGALGWLAGADALHAQRTTESLRAQIAADPLGLLRDLLLARLWYAVRFVPLGFLATLPLGRHRTWPERVVKVWAPALVLAFALAVGVVGFASGHTWSWPSGFDLVLPAIGCVLGVWLGVSWLKGWSARLWALPKLAFLALLLAGGVAGFLFLGAESEPLEFEPATAGSSERQRVYQTFKDKNPATLPEGKTAELRLTDQDLNIILAWGLALGEPGRKARVELTPDHATVRLSVQLPAGRYLNVVGRADARVADGTLSLFPFRFNVGRLETPTWLLELAGPVAARLIARDRRIEPLLSRVQQLQLEEDALTLRYGRAELPPGFLAELFHGEGTTQEDLPAIRAHVEHLIASAPTLPRDAEARFGASLETAFRFAQARSKDGQAVRENRAAVLALGILLGHRRVDTLVGGVADPAAVQKSARSLQGTTLRGRADWPKHFFVSASLSLLAVGGVGDAAGLLKEELDADGGSGFSFADLLADRAGVTFAATATRDESAARALQAHLARGFKVDDFFPPARDLPEGLQDAELRARFGGVGGEGYRRLAEDIEQRIRTCAAYRL